MSKKSGPAKPGKEASLEKFPFYEKGKVPQYHKYHGAVSYLAELELIWGKRWGAQGIGRLRGTGAAGLILGEALLSGAIDFKTATETAA